ncbi:MAG: hypothetical protein DYG92_06995 [Leptolyngbya sp. PLA1]|nr:hypothetical protein [Leptolyngbya sp. PLA1]
MRRTLLIALSLPALAWAGGLVVLGLALLGHGAAGGPLPQVVGGRDWLGLAALAGGLFVFMLLVADRWFPRAAPRAVAILEAAVFALFALTLVGFGVSLSGLAPS